MLQGETTRHEADLLSAGVSTATTYDLEDVGNGDRGRSLIGAEDIVRDRLRDRLITVEDIEVRLSDSPAPP